MAVADSHTTSPLERPRLSDAIYGQLLQEIMAGRFATGERLPTENQLAQRFAVSRPVVREALQRLQSDGVVISRQGSGTYVQRSPSQRVAELTQTVSLREVLQGLELRLSLEELSARLAARHRSDEHLRAIQQAGATMQAQFDDARASREADYAFHRAIALASGNPLLAQVLDHAGERLRSGMHVTLSLTRAASDQRRARVLDEHERIVHAIAVGDPDSAAIAMRYHLDQARNRLLDRQFDQ